MMSNTFLASAIKISQKNKKKKKTLKGRKEKAIRKAVRKTMVANWSDPLNSNRLSSVNVFGHR